MNTLRLVLTLGLLAYSAYSVILYLARRAQSKGALHDLQRQGQPVRRLTDEERGLVQPFLVDPLKPAKVAPLLSDGVYEVVGPWQRHGLQGQHQAKAVHDTLGDVEVVLPYDALDHLQEANRAEVVLTKGFAVVVALNGRFDLAGGKARAAGRQVAERQWKAGAPGAVAEVAEVAEGAAGTVRLLGQRDETPAEAEARVKDGRFLALALLLPAFVLIVVAGHLTGPLPWLATGAVALVAGLWLAWRPRRTPAPERVNRAEGPLLLVDLRSPQNAEVSRPQLFLGDQFPIQLPPHWAGQVDLPPAGRADLELRVSDHSVVRFGRGLSIDSEVRRHPLVRWGRHLTLGLAGLGMALVAWLLFGDPGHDLAHAGAVLRPGAAEAVLRDPAAVRAAPPAPGSLVRVQGPVRCELPEADGDRPGPVGCERVRWGGAAPALDPVVLPPELARLASGAAVEARADPLAAAILSMTLAASGDDRATALGSVSRISRLSSLVLAVDARCRGEAPEPPCASLRELLGGKLLVDGVEGEPDWVAVLAAARDGRLARAGDRALASSATVASVRRAIAEVVAPEAAKFYRPALERARAGLRGGVVLTLDAGRAAALRGGASAEEEGTEGGGDAAPGDGAPLTVTAAAAEVDAAAAAAAGVPVPSAPEDGQGRAVALPPDSASWPEQWATYERLAASEGLRPIDLAGLVVGTGRDAGGDLLLEIDPRRTRLNALPAVARVAALGMGLLLALVHLPLLAWAALAARRRAAAVAADFGGAAPRRPGRS